MYYLGRFLENDSRRLHSDGWRGNLVKRDLSLLLVQDIYAGFALERLVEKSDLRRVYLRSLVESNFGRRHYDWRLLVLRLWNSDSSVLFILFHFLSRLHIGKDLLLVIIFLVILKNHFLFRLPVSYLFFCLVFHLFLFVLFLFLSSFLTLSLFLGSSLFDIYFNYSVLFVDQ